MTVSKSFSRITTAWSVTLAVSLHAIPVQADFFCSKLLTSKPVSIKKEKLLIQTQLSVNARNYLTRFNVTSEEALGRLNATTLGINEAEYGVFKDYVRTAMEIRINQKPELRGAVSEKGILNLHQTRTSGGIPSPALRNEREAQLLGTKKSNYRRFESESKPKYGSVTLLGKKLHELANTNVSLGAKGFGSDSYVLNSDIAARTSFFVDDSLLWTMNPNESFAHFLPLDRTDIFIHVILDRAKLNWAEFRSALTEGGGALTADELREVQFAKSQGLTHQSNEVMLLYLGLQIDRNYFFETQIWGELSPDAFRMVYLDPLTKVNPDQIKKWEGRKTEAYYLPDTETTQLEKLH